MVDMVERGSSWTNITAFSARKVIAIANYECGINGSHWTKKINNSML